MDPNATLHTIREFVRDFADGCTSHQGCEHSAELAEISEAIDALDVWISRGGFPPVDWERR